MNPSRKWLYLSILFLCSQLFVGMVCSRALDVSVHIKKQFLFPLSFDDLMKQSKIPKKGGAIDGKVKKRSLDLEFVRCLDLSEHKEFKEYREKVHSIYVNQLEMHVEDKKNSLNLDLPKMEVQFARVLGNSKDLCRGSFTKNKPVGSFASLLAGQDEQENAMLWESDGYDRSIQIFEESFLGKSSGLSAAPAQFKQFAIAVRVNAPLQIQGGDTYPKGEIFLLVDLSLTFVLNAL